METAVDVPECVTSRPNGRSKYVYVNTVKKLQAQAEQQAQLHQELSQQIGLQLLGQSVLADGICQQKVVYDVIIPLHQQWLQDPDQDLAGRQHQQHSRWQLPHPELATLVGLMENCNPIVSSLLKASPRQVQEAAALTLEELVAAHTKLFTELVVILELISPGRYQGEDVGSATAAIAAGSACAGPQDVLGEHAQEYAGSCSTGAAALEAEAQAARVAKAAAEVRMAELVQQSYMLAGLIVLHNPSLMMQVCSTNLSTMQHCVAPRGHYVKAAERLGLAGQQHTLMGLMLKQFNRSMKLQVQKGLDLVKLSKDSATLQVIAVAAQNAGAQLAGKNSACQASLGISNGLQHGAGCNAAAAAAGICSSCRCAGALNGRSTLHSRGRLSIASRLLQQQQQQPEVDDGKVADLSAEGLSDRLQKHLGERLQLLQMIGFWVANTLSVRQMAKFIVYSWPYYPICSALAEASTLLQPAAATAAGASAAGDCSPDAEDTQRFVEWRSSGMRAELDWVMRHPLELSAGAVQRPDAY